ncbi:phosphatidylserine decarboxylase [Legionella israelensis]|uniref:archaetidylserine decarboxylase n=1 Tax=Legionella israelensis TaxID=454 RepID=UPI00117D8E4C|nr:archaetidylserine decarboxylase [Legionella israelensis]QDP71510.1 phosphatidylserine decarboxylase [Legionella israelensis]
MVHDYLKTLPQYLLPKSGITALAGRFANVKKPSIKNFLIRQFIAQYQVDMSEALIEDPSAYESFNDFFIRRLKPECRPLASTAIISPVDGTISEIGNIEQGQLLQAKKRFYTVDELLGSETAMAKSFHQGRFVTLYLSPKDYHRVHIPIACTLQEMSYLPGKLFSVQPATTRVIKRLFARNERLAIYFETKLGLMAMVMVGATIVGAIGTSWHGDLKRSRRSVHFDYKLLNQDKTSFLAGEEMGYFKLGSTVILMFADKSKMKWCENLQAGQNLRFGEPLGDLIC